MREELLEKAQYKNNEEREELKTYFTQPPDMDMAKKTIVFSTPSETGTSFFRLFEPMKALWKAFLLSAMVCLSLNCLNRSNS